MSFLDTRTARRDDARIVALHEILIRAYPDKVEALSIAGSVGILQADIAVEPKMRLTWWSVLEEAAHDGVLRRLVCNVLQDPTVAGFQGDVRGILDIPESELAAGAPARRPGGKAHTSGLRPSIGDRAPLWPTGQVLRVRFLDGDPALREKVEQAAVQWVDHANLWLDFGTDPNAELRISFQQPASWSYLGTACLQVPDPQPNINFGWLTPDTEDTEIHRVVLHEFGHVLGMQHEQGNPASPIKWKKDVVYQEMGGPPNNWSREQVDWAFFAIWPPGYYPVHKIFDPASINMLPIPAKFLQSGIEVGWNTELTPLDKQFAAALYPQRAR